MDEIKVIDKQTGKEVLIPLHLYDPGKHLPMVVDAPDPEPAPVADDEMSHDSEHGEGAEGESEVDEEVEKVDEA